MGNHILQNQVTWHTYTGQELSLKGITHLFKIDVNTYYDQIRTANFLSVDELNKAGKYLKEEDTANFVVRKHFLRVILSRLLPLKPEQIEYHRVENKKPAVTGLQFNVSHSKDCAIIAVSSYAIGIDVEHINPDFEFEDVMSYCFNQEELAFVTEAKHPVLNFFTLWTRKEALLKATGEGLLDQLELVPSMHTCLIRNTKEFLIKSFPTADQYLISVATGDSSQEIKLWEYKEMVTSA